MPLKYIGVDAQYFSVVVQPRMEKPQDVWFASSRPIRVTPAKEVNHQHKNWTNTSFRVESCL